MHNNKTFSLNFIKNNPSLFIFTKFSVEKNKCWEIFKILRKLLFYF